MSKHRYDLIIVDEAKRIRGRDGKAFTLLKPLSREAEYVWLLTGTPGKLPGDFFTMFHLLDHRYFSSYWKFVEAFCYVQKNEFGAFEVLGLKNPDAWYQLLEFKASILTKKDVGHRETVRQVLHVDMDPKQAKLYKELDESMFAFSGDQMIIAQTHMTKVLRFRQLLCCPKILDPEASIGAAFEDYVETIKNDTDPHTVVFTPFITAIPYFERYLHENGFSNTFALSGGLDPDELQRRIEAWRKTKGQLICSILYATAFSLEPATECFFIGYEWDPEDNAQAEERLNRLTTKEQVNAYYYAYNGTYTSQHLQILTDKQRQIQQTTGQVRPTKI
jgi:SNF2 family DNA or RNA helicase